MNHQIIGADEMVRTQYVGPSRGHVMNHVLSDVPVRAAIVDDTGLTELAFGGPERTLRFGTIARSSLRWFVVIENPNEGPANISWYVSGLS